jgi:hypothetical protein
MERARVKRFFANHGYGFLEIPGKPDLFFHTSDRLIRRYEPSKSGEPALVSSHKPSWDESRTPHEDGGEWVMFEPSKGRDQRPKAMNWNFAEHYDILKFESIRLSGQFDDFEDLLQTIGDVALTDYCAQHGRYINWEEKIASPALSAQGLTVVQWYTIDGDSFGPLVRGVKVYDNTKAMILTYG